MNINFSRFFWNLFPSYYKENDTNVDPTGKGTLERYMEIFGDQIDANIIPKVEQWVDILGIDAPDQDKYYNHQAYTYGNPPIANFSDYLMYRRVLEFIVSVYKIKGTALSFEAFFRLMGYTVLATQQPCPAAMRYDELNEYDNGFLYDQTGCCTCVDMELTVLGRLDFAAVTPNDIALVDLLKDFLTPININVTVN